MPITRREWLCRAALLATGAVAADQLDLLDRLGWTRTMFPSAGVPSGGVEYAFESGWRIGQPLGEWRGMGLYFDVVTTRDMFPTRLGVWP